MKRFANFPLFSLLAVVLALFVPVIPVLRAPVVPDPTFSLVYAPLADIACPMLLGIRYEIQWYTVLAALGLLAAAWHLGRWLDAKRRKRNQRHTDLT